MDNATLCIYRLWIFSIIAYVSMVDIPIMVRILDVYGVLWTYDTISYVYSINIYNQYYMFVVSHGWNLDIKHSAIK